MEKRIITRMKYSQKKKRGKYMIWLYIGLSLSKVFSNAKEHDKKP
jgi:hypothetical protein